MMAIGNKTVAARRVTINGVRKMVFEWCRDLKLHYPTVRSRIVKHGYTPRDAITKPIRDPRPDAHAGADPKLLRVIADATGMPLVVRRRYKRVPKHVLNWRQAAIWAAYKLGLHTLTDISDFFGSKSHATVLYHVNRFQERLEANDSEAWKAKLKIEKWVDMAIEEESTDGYGSSVCDEAAEVIDETNDPAAERATGS